MNPYDTKQQACRHRLNQAADKAEARAADAYDRADLSEEKSGIPLGQPILVGHHSEHRHRRAIERADKAMRKSVEETQRAETLRARADAVGKGGISSDDPDALAKLRAKLADLQVANSNMKGWNAQFRRAKGDLSGKVAAMSAPDTVKAEILTSMSRMPHLSQPFSTANTAAEIRRLKRRITELEARRARPAADDVIGDGWRLIEDQDANRLRFYFDARPDRETCRLLKSRGFKWAPSVGAWQRQITANGRQAARDVFEALATG